MLSKLLPVTRTKFRPTVLASLLALSLGLLSTGQARADDVSDVQALLAAGKAAEGLKKVEQLLAAKPEDPRLRLQRGIALSLLNRNAEAIGVFQKLIDSHPELPGPYNNLAVLYGNQGEYEKARQALELAIRTNPAYATAFQNLGDVYARLAGQAYKKALALDKSDGVLPLKLAVVQNIFETSVDPRKPATPAASPAPAPSPAAAPAAPVATAPAPATKPTPAPTPATATPAPAPVVAAAPTPAPAPTPKPAAAPMPAPAPAALAAAPSPAPVAKAEPSKAESSAAADRQAVENTLQAWAKAWSSRDMSGYYAAYVPEFKGKLPNRKAWEQERRERITSKKNIKVKLSDIKIKLQGDKATVSLRQDYSSDALSVKSSKSFTLSKGRSGRWQIADETNR
ncbi:YybH family protein [Paucibacter sp. DJ2R-2]|uniref:YybH family protein n=1 Tax=Paucibacter sp. DJ2R-2 TaxID=2893558 RepID=UPI0021E44EC9|nr:tetratricopeptide repeat protein [Paucibacter sp. DJ2R-2]MCV2420266.1 tetratricopeptide repeat protein [Paucibacter sp. DJ4R-1]MCV2436789.1 tetratricopeptide repeat protein [Paucibacter sp. DJ2R-2]